MIGSKAIITKDNKKDKELAISIGTSCVSAPERIDSAIATLFDSISIMVRNLEHIGMIRDTRLC